MRSALPSVFRRKYDRIYSFGQWCATAMYLRACSLRSASGPFDWFRPKELKPMLPTYFAIVANGFADFMRQENLCRIESCVDEGRDHYLDGVSGLVSFHDFRCGDVLAETYGAFRRRLDRRIVRFEADLSGGGSLLLVHFLGEGHYGRDEIVAALDRLRDSHPGTRVDLLVLECDAAVAGVRYEQVADGLVFAVGDFYDPTKYAPVLGNEKLCRTVFSRLCVRGRWRNFIRQRVASFRRRIRRRF